MTQDVTAEAGMDFPEPGFPGAVFDVQDDILVVCNDLDRLIGLLSGACAELSSGFHEVNALVAQRRAVTSGEEGAFLGVLEQRLSSAVTALQFEDMASQLIGHTRRLLRSGADRLAADAFGSEDGDVPVDTTPRRPNPVTQDEMDAGSVELF